MISIKGPKQSLCQLRYRPLDIGGEGDWLFKAYSNFKKRIVTAMPQAYVTRSKASMGKNY